jgi:molecular chaperone IbpA
LDIPSIHKFGIGFDNIFNELDRLTQANQSNYPPYNILKQSDNDFSIEIAVAGFREGDISISVEKNILTVKGQQLETVDEEGKTTEYLHRGISARDFVRTFTLADHVEVVGAVNQHGILSINLKRIVPLEELPKQIDIKYLT